MTNYIAIFIIKLENFNYLYYKKVIYFVLEKEEKVEIKYKNVKYKLLQL